jgi:tetratricopeptide (TPR) repeat protein
MMTSAETISSLLDELSRVPADARIDRLRQRGPIEEVVLALVDESEQLAAGEAGRASQATEFVVSLADTIEYPRAQARARRIRARALAYAGRFEDALAVCGEAIAIAAQADEHVEAGRARLASMHALGELGRLGEAITVGDEARKTFLSVDEPGMAARADINLGIVYQRQDRQAEALRCFVRARPALADEPMMLGHLEINRGEALVSLNRFAEAEEAFNAAQSAAEAAQATVTAGIAEGNLADLAARQGKLHAALYHFERARRCMESGRSPTHHARLLAEQAEAKATLGMPVDALADYDEALHELDQCGMKLESARARLGLGTALLRLQRWSAAETALAAAATAFNELGHATSRAKVDLVRADLALRSRRLTEARQLATRALAQLQGRPADAAAARCVMGRVAIDEGIDDLAEADLAAALAEAQRLDLAPLLADIFHTRGRWRRRLGRLETAIEDLGRAMEQVERVRGSLQAMRFRAAFLGDHAATYEALVDALLDRAGDADVARAFAAAERAKSRSMLDERQTLHSDQLDIPDHETVDIAEHELRAEHARLQSDLNALYSTLDGDHVARDQGSVESWQRAIHERERQLTALETRLAATSALRRQFAPPAGLEEIQAALADDQTLVEYFACDGSLMAFVVDRRRVSVARDLGAIADVVDHLERLRFQVERALRPGALSGRRSERMVVDARSELQSLDEMLLAPLRRHVDGRQRLTIVPHGPLHLIPFHALHDGEKYLLEHHEVSYAPSASLFARFSESSARQSNELRPMVVGVADEFAPQIEHEAERIGAQIGCDADDVLLADDATIARVLDDAPLASMIHFACHGRFTRDNPHGSGLRLADGWLTLRQIGALRLRCRLAVLSGCETGLNLVSAGDELLGLLRVFLTAGADAVLASLWRVDDEHTVAFMTRFYQAWTDRLGESISPTGAVRSAQLELLAEHPHPAIWAPFFLVGDS